MVMRGVSMVLFGTRVWAWVRTGFLWRFSRDLSIMITITSTTATRSLVKIFNGRCFKMLIKGRSRWFWLRLRFLKLIESNSTSWNRMILCRRKKQYFLILRFRFIKTTFSFYLWSFWWVICNNGVLRKSIGECIYFKWTF